jgi:chromosome segregation ATPase
LSATRAVADDAAANHTDDRMREALRNTMLQLRDAQNQVATLQASQAASDQQNTDLKAKLDTMTTQLAAVSKQAADDQADSQKTIADLKSQVADQTAEVARYASAIDEWKKAYAQVTGQSKAREAARIDLAGKVIVLQRMVDDRERQNLDLFKTGNDILDRYQNFSLGDVLASKEPFIGVNRVHLQEQVQDYKDKLLDSKVRMGQVSPAPAAPVPATSAAPPAATTAASVPAKSAVPAE